MKKISYILFMQFILFINVFYVQASCTNEELTELRNEVNKIKITYKHMGPVQSEDMIDYNRFEVTVKNIPDDFYITYSVNNEKLVPSDGIAKTTLNNGNWIFKVFSDKCDDEISVIKVFLPKFNMYSLDPLCEGIDGNKFPLCGKYYEYDVDYENFKDRVEHYRATYKINVKENNDVHNEKTFFENVMVFIQEYKIYFISFSAIFLLIILLIIILKKRKRRGVLE